ncbi:MAG: hypothetical protein H0Z34_02980 [Brevibacillus sp.]|nr:hypothetical protein [Brevibacillus sp.]
MTLVASVVLTAAGIYIVNRWIGSVTSGAAPVPVEAGKQRLARSHTHLSSSHPFSVTRIFAHL